MNNTTYILSRSLLIQQLPSIHYPIREMMSLVHHAARLYGVFEKELVSCICKQRTGNIQ